MNIELHVLGASFFATLHASPEDALAGVTRPFTPPAFALLAGRARRFTSLVTQMHLEVCGALPAARGLPAVFATCHGEIQTAQKLIADFRQSAVVSSAAFSQSVHNTPAGLYSVATGSAAPATTITGDNAVAAAWLEAALVARDAGGPVLLSIADEPVPDAFLGPSEACGVAAAFIVTAAAPGAGLPARLILDDRRTTSDGLIKLLARAVLAVTGRTPAAIPLGEMTLQVGPS